MLSRLMSSEFVSVWPSASSSNREKVLLKDEDGADCSSELPFAALSI